MLLRSLLLLTCCLSASFLVTEVDAQVSLAPSCGCCPSPRCSAQPVLCSTNADCVCLLMTVTGGGLCANTIISCANLTRCGSDNQTCSTPNTVCVKNTRCNVPVCYPIAQATPNVCPPVTSTVPITTTASTTRPLPTTTTTTTTSTPINACLNRSLCLNNGTCQPSGSSFFCLCNGSFYGARCEYGGTLPDLGIDGILNGTTNGSERTVETVLSRNNWTNIVAVIDVTGSMKPCAAAVYKWMVLSYGLVNKIRYYVFFNDGDNKPDSDKVIGSTGGIYGVDTGNLDTVLRTMKTAMYNGDGGDGPENDMEALLFGIRQCPNCSNTILVADNQVTPRDLILVSNVTKPVKVIVCQLYGNVLNTNLLNIAMRTGGSIHTLEEDIINLSGIPVNGTITIGSRLYRRTASGYVWLS